jgi:hypothetical protein
MITEAMDMDNPSLEASLGLRVFSCNVVRVDAFKGRTGVYVFV